jgi:dihydroorotase
MSAPDPSVKRFDLVISGGLVVDPDAGDDAPQARDVAVRDGRIAAIVAPGTADARSRQVLDARGLLVTPGLIDLHTHVYAGRTGLGVRADAVGVEQAVTTVVDAGSAGSDCHPHFAEAVVTPAATRVLSWLNISRHGLTLGTRELAGDDDIHPAAVAATILGDRRTIRGIKVRMSRSVVGGNGLEPLRRAKRVAAEVGAAVGRRLPVMVHVGNEPPALGDVLDLLGPGDIVTHAFHGKPGGLFGGPAGAARDTTPAGATPAGGQAAPGAPGGADRAEPIARGEPIAQARAALRRGVRFDVGHGSASFAFRTLERALAAGIRPHTVSTDIHRRNLEGPVYGPATTMTKLLAVGLTLPETVRAATSAPAESLGLAGELGPLRSGAVADLSLLRLVPGAVLLRDAEGETRTAERSLVPVGAVRAGTVHDSRRAA